MPQDHIALVAGGLRTRVARLRLDYKHYDGKDRTMKRSDRELGMNRSISRRDFLNGVGAVAAGTLVPGRALA
ncbi:MAG: twin-arginine translocation signal domain-containing protein, partial [Deltaproteobacteria bacterium]|nr:twin-arginine translocation signal domain-containing protein [Deltaproteobacteria bacterium]